MDIRQFRDFIVRPALQQINAWTLNAEQLVMARELDDIHKMGTKTSRELTQYEFIKAKERVSVQKRKTLIV